LAQVDIYNKHKAMYNKGKKITDPKKRKAYAEKHADELAEYNSALAYLKNHLNGYGKIPEKEWRDELKRLLAERYSLVDEYHSLNDDLKNVEALRRGADKIMRGIEPEQAAVRARALEIG
jgi:hypothetical protein